MSAWGFIHGLLGAALVAGLAVAIWQSLSPASGLEALRVNAVAMASLALVIDLLGDLVYVTYRAATESSPRSAILASSEPWVHKIFMEFKEHVAHFVPPLLLVAVAVVFVYDIRRRELATPRKVAATLFIAALAITLAVLFMGAYASSLAPVR